MNDTIPPDKEHETQGATITRSTPVKVAMAMARSPWKFLLGSLLSATVLSLIGLVVGKFSIAVENDGWKSRQTLISNRDIQRTMLMDNQELLFDDEDGSEWEFLENNKKKGWDFYNRRLSAADGNTLNTEERRLEPFFSDCGAEWYKSDFIPENNLICAWRPKGQLSALDPEVLLEICKAEQNTLAVMESENACLKYCGKCLPPHSLILVLRDHLRSSVTDALEIPCEDLINLYSSSVRSDFTAMLVNCTDSIKEMFALGASKDDYKITSCPDSLPFIATVVERSFSKESEMVHYTSSYFPTDTLQLDRLNNVVDEMDRGDGSIVQGSYSTGDGYFIDILVDKNIEKDMLLATTSFLITMIAILVHTRSPWLACIGILQIFFSIPLAYFVYYFVAQFKFFPFLNFIGIFVVAALGADDVFVAVDKWKNARMEHPNATTEEVASIALPDAASAMFYTTITTCVAFFATAICVVAPIRCFAVFCGLLIFFDYVMDIALIFPALCLYDKWLMNGNANCCVIICKKQTENINERENSDTNSDYDDTSLIHRILNTYYKYLHMLRWPILAIFTIGFGVFIYVATTLRLPDSAEVRLLPEDHQFELSIKWRQKLLAQQYSSGSGSSVQIIWGLQAEDNGNINNPDELSSLVLDDSFEPRSAESQIYLQAMCSRLFKNEFAGLLYTDYVCPINGFESWLNEQATSKFPDEEYEDNCRDASALPMPSDSFDACFIAWSKINRNIDVLAKNGKIQVLIVQATSTAHFTDAYSILKREWQNFEDWLDVERNKAPKGVNAMYHSSNTFWFYDTNRTMLQTAIGAAGIAIAFSTVVVFIVSRSFLLTLFSTVAIVYVLAATTASLVGLGWTLGFLESICLAILIGISCDFVIHFSHAYCHFRGKRSREDRTRFTVVHMGPSILAAAATTFSAATVMLFCKITFFTKFASILFMTMLHATIGAFVGFLVLADLFGPSEPTKLVDTQLAKCFHKNKSKSEDNNED